MLLNGKYKVVKAIETSHGMRLLAENVKNQSSLVYIFERNKKIVLEELRIQMALMFPHQYNLNFDQTQEENVDLSTELGYINGMLEKKTKNTFSILNLIEAFEEYQKVYLVTEYLPSLAECPKMTKQNKISLINNLGLTLKWIHSQGVALRYFTQDTVFYDAKKDELKFGDFRWAEAMRTFSKRVEMPTKKVPKNFQTTENCPKIELDIQPSAKAEKSKTMISLKFETLVLGAIGEGQFVSPEMFFHYGNCGVKIDYYCFGVVMYWFLFRTMPFPRADKQPDVYYHNSRVDSAFDSKRALEQFTQQNQADLLTTEFKDMVSQSMPNTSGFGLRNSASSTSASNSFYLFNLSKKTGRERREDLHFPHGASQETQKFFEGLLALDPNKRHLENIETPNRWSLFK